MEGTSSFVRKVVLVFSGVRRLRNGIKEGSTYDEGSYVL